MEKERMRIYLIRHSNAVDIEAADLEPDEQRPLSEKGREKMKNIACALKALGVKPNLIVSSSYVRAEQSAQILKKVLECKKDVAITKVLVPFGDPSEIIGEINERYTVDELILVGHEPCLSGLIGAMASSAPEILITLKYGGVCCLSADDLRMQRVAAIDWILTPKILSHVARSTFH
jgi:phosphohistidine phosphatase